MSQPLTLQYPKPTRRVDQGPIVGCYPGTVVATATDATTEGRIQVRVDQVYGRAVDVEKIEDVDLPFARPAFPTTGVQSGSVWVPPVGAGVWVMFWAGSFEHPVWFGGYYGEGEVPAEFSSSYSPDPRTRLVKTDNGHTFEMRWVEGQEQIIIRTAGGQEFLLTDATALDGPKAVVSAGAQQYQLELGGAAQVARLKTATQVFEMLPGAVNLNAPTSATTATLLALTATLTAALVVTASAVITLTAGAAMTLTAVGTLTLSAAVLAFVSAGAVALGSLAGVKKALVNEDFLTLYNGHTHAAPGTPTAALGIPGTHSTVNTKAD